MNEKLSDILRVGDKVTIYKSRGGNWSAPVLEISDERHEAKLDLSAFRGGILGNSWFEIKISKRGIPYAQD